uniref:Uncharacterized protein n=1 Tax=Cacopsylla melanoneura TaxID=428564 RepID=A0A8D8ZTJ5_9HEMI
MDNRRLMAKHTNCIRVKDQLLDDDSFALQTLVGTVRYLLLLVTTSVFVRTGITIPNKEFQSLNCQNDPFLLDISPWAGLEPPGQATKPQRFYDNKMKTLTRNPVD